MLLLLIFAFIAGVVTILSPCILPILPIVLSGSITGGKRRPIGIITGFIVSFTFFTLFLTSIVKATGLPADVLRNASVFIILVFGLSLIIPQFQILFERFLSRVSGLLTSKISQNQKNPSEQGFLSGILVGVSLGLVWTPCVGPILASIISLAFTGSITGTAFLITLTYSAGTAIPMLAITYGGRNLLTKNPWLIKNTANMQKAFGVIMIATAFLILFNLDRKFQTYILKKFPNYGVGLTKFEDIEAVRRELSKIGQKKVDREKIGKPMLDILEENLGNAPELIPGGNWFNLPEGKKELTLKELRGKVVLVDFWTYTCINCIRTLPYLKTWHEKYKDKGLVIIGVHTPEFEFEKNPKNVAKAIKDFGLTYPIVQDNDYATWNAYANRYWPAKYFIDKNGKIRSTHFGEGAYDESEEIIRKLLQETGSDVSQTDVGNPSYQLYARTPELYLGYTRIQYFASKERISEDKQTNYSFPDNLPSNYFAYAGRWTVGEERAQPTYSSSLWLNFEAQEVFLVMRPIGTAKGQLRVFIDDEPVNQDNSGVDVVDGLVTVDTDRLYRLIKLVKPGEHLLKLDFLDGNIELYAFTFG